MTTTRLGHFDSLGNDIIVSEIIKRLVDTNLQGAVALSLTSRTFYALFENALADKLLQLLVDVTYINQWTSLDDLDKCMQQINNLVKGRPMLMFTVGNAISHDNFKIRKPPVSYLFSTLDVSNQTLFFTLAVNKNLIMQFAEMVKDIKCSSNIDGLIYSLDDYLNELAKYKNLANDDEISNHNQHMNDLVLSHLAPAQLQLERDILEAVIPPENIDLFKRFINKRNFALFKTESGDLKSQKTSMTSTGTARQKAMWTGIFNEQSDLRNAIIQEAVQLSSRKTLQ